MERPSTSRDDHSAGRRARELYRYFQPERLTPLEVNDAPLADNVLPPAVAQALDASIHASSAPPPPPPPPQLSPPLVTTDVPSDHSSPSSPVVPETLVLGQNNATLTSFAHLAALRLNVERVIIRYFFFFFFGGLNPTRA